MDHTPRGCFPMLNVALIKYSKGFKTPIVNSEHKFIKHLDHVMYELKFLILIYQTHSLPQKVSY